MFSTHRGVNALDCALLPAGFATSSITCLSSLIETTGWLIDTCEPKVCLETLTKLVSSLDRKAQLSKVQFCLYPKVVSGAVEMWVCGDVVGHHCLPIGGLR